jgi:hypothetical protein
MGAKRNDPSGPVAVGLLSGDRPEEAVDQRACVEWQSPTQKLVIFAFAAVALAETAVAMLGLTE